MGLIHEKLASKIFYFLSLWFTTNLFRISQNNNRMVSVTETAKKKIFSLLEEEGMGRDAYVKVGVSSGGCSGLSYKLDFTKDKSEGDKLIEDNGVKILIDKKSLLYLVGTVLDFSGGLNGKGFTFNNPNASRTCGCGESFAV